MDYALFHSPYTKLVRKSYARLLFLDFISNPNSPAFASLTPKQKETFTKMPLEETYTNKELATVFEDLTNTLYSQHVDPTLMLPKRLGNSYTASLYTGLQSLIVQKQDADLVGKRLWMFSYGR